MNKKNKTLLGFTVLLLSLSVCFLFSDNTENRGITLANVEALTTPEDSDKPKATCIYVGTICGGINAEGDFGYHPGLSIEE